MRQIIVLLSLALLPAAALANGYDVPNVNPRDLALVGSALAAQHDAGAAYVNPAALAKVRGLSLSASGSFLDLRTEWSAPEGSTLAGAPDAATRFKPVPPVALYAAYGFDLFGRATGVGLGMNVPGGGNVFWDEGWAGRGRIITVDRKVYGLYLTGGHALTPWLRVGGGLVYYYTTEYLKMGVQPSLDSYGELATKGGGASFDLSAEIQPLAAVPLTIAVDYKHKGAQALRGDGNFVVPDALLQPGTDPASVPPIDQGVRHDLTFPNVLNVGLAYRPLQPLLLTGGYTFNRTSVYASDSFVGDKGTTIDVARNYGNGHTFRLGAEYEVMPRLTVRAGVLRDLSGLSTDTYSPTLPDSNAWAAAVGAGWKISPDLAVSGAVFHAWLDEVKSTGAEALPGVYDSRVYIVSAGIAWRTDLVRGR